MIQQQIYLKVANNIGAEGPICIRVLGGTGRRYANIGDVMVALIKKTAPGGAVRGDGVVRMVTTCTTFGVRRHDGTCIRLDKNAAVIIKDDENPRGTRAFEPVARELYDKGYLKILNLASEVL